MANPAIASQKRDKTEGLEKKVGSSPGVFLSVSLIHVTCYIPMTIDANRPVQVSRSCSHLQFQTYKPAAGCPWNTHIFNPVRKL